MLDPIWLILISLCLALLPILFSLISAYLKVSIVLGIFKNAIGAQQIPSGIVIMGLSLAITIFIMKPVFLESNNLLKDIEIQTLQKSKISEVVTVISPALVPYRKFLQKHSGPKEINLLLNLEKKHNPEKFIESKNNHNPDFFILTTAFLLTELKEAFMIGFIIMLPFLVIDLVIANLLAGLGMYMLSPVLISLPIKLLIIVGFDAWLLIFKGLFYSYV